MPIPAASSSLPRSLLRDDVYRRLRDAIVDGTFEPGEQLRDGDLAAWLGVSRTPVREALLRLSGSGLVVSQPGRSTTVSPIEQSALRDARDVVAAMHELAVRETVGRLTPADIARMRDANRRFTAAAERGDVSAALDADDELHAVPIEVLGNAAVVTVLEQFGPIVRRAERLRFGSDAPAAAERHERFIALCEKQDAAAAAAMAYETWHTLPVSAEARPPTPRDGDR
ncbi:GntR family transcriptional regulator [Microbacterium sp. ABRD28]|uniref:GntR family transcriptional regulator n=1 Tax=Microbacterium sp. ABRD28 TaxID=2268461 RepID=UPI000F555B63|nr:GntR family transcriptional regulator [Microbacterium sp. ABRD28]AZC12661.1 GntR family transcriptional regulator [Microbacterium sp. ABRD28]